MRTINFSILLLAYYIAYALPTHAQKKSAPPVLLRYNIGGPSIFGYRAEKHGWIYPKNTRTSLLNEHIVGSLPQFALKTHRWAKFSFSIRIPIAKSGIYSCSLHWAETSKFFKGKGRRVFNVSLNKKTLYGIDVFRSVGFKREYKRTIANIPVNKYLTVSLKKRHGDPFLSALICKRKVQTGLPKKFDLNIGGPNIFGFFAEKRSWVFPKNTRLAFSNKMVSGSKPSFFLGTHRWAKTSFTIRVPIAHPGTYYCTCYWAEISKFYAKSYKRVFNIVLNGRRINNIDVFKYAGMFKEYKRSIGHISVGKYLVIRLEKVRGDPFLSGISCHRA